MSVQTAAAVKPTIEWDDSVVIVFSFAGSDGNNVYSGFPHVIPAWQQQTGEQTQISKTVQTIQQNALQISADPATWVETIKFGARDKDATIKIVYDDAFVHYTTPVGTISYDLHLLYSISG